jgi:hypothetical protein
MQLWAVRQRKLVAHYCNYSKYDLTKGATAAVLLLTLSLL